MKRFLSVLLLLPFLLLAGPKRSAAQCTQTISSFPYSESFETGNGGWVPGGTASDWSWGTPLKTVINSAGSGSKCWVNGTLTQSSYTNNQNSTLTSPCFNFSTLTQPYIKMKIFWETEKKYDGATFQYSIDGGNSWSTLGSNADFQNCPNDNWFNTASVTALGNDGWSGNIQPTAPCAGGAGNGSGSWKLARHALYILAGKPNVRFRFRFASGSVCNNYDGFAVDDIWIGDATPSGSAFTFQCTGGSTASFLATTVSCNATYAWSFGDVASGTANSSTLSNPTHNFSGPGIYTVALTVTEPGLPPSTTNRQIIIPELVLALQQPIRCKGTNDAALSASISPAAGYSYLWNTSQTTSSISGLGPGTYTLTVTAPDACPASDFVTVTEPDALTRTLSQQDPLCGGSNGKASIQESGGTPPYQYNWLPNVSSTGTALGLAAGTYQVRVTDSRGCTDSASFILQDQNGLSVGLGRDTTICKGQTLTLNPGSFATYQWQDGSSAPTYLVTSTGRYSVTVTDGNGCTASGAIQVTVDCGDIYFPTAFTPNGDGRNEGFGAVGNLGAVTSYSLKVFNRWGELVFATTDPSRKWKGQQGGAASGTQIFVWTAEYGLNGRTEKQQRKGVVTCIR